MTTGLIAALFAVTLAPGATDVVVVKNAAPFVRYAADELTNRLSRVLGASVPVVDTPREGRSSIILGENAWSKAAGLDPSVAPRDTFFTKAEGSVVYICGRDAPSFDIYAYLEKGGSYAQLMYNERATLHGAYAFLEKYAGVRYYWPDEELGVIVPRRAAIEVPDGSVKTTPDNLIREIYAGGDGDWYNANGPVENGRLKALMWLRLRLSSYRIPCCHGIQKFDLPKRFAKTHPEYFAKPGTNHLCWTNPEVREIIYQDVKKRLQGGEDAVDIMPEDGFRPCHCARCQAAYENEKGVDGYASSLMWGVAAEIGNRLKAEGVKGSITMMAYSPYCNVPTFHLPDNIQVMVAEYGPWSMVRPDFVAKQYADIRAWRDKLGHPVWIWTYPMKHGRLDIADVPQMAPHAWGAYYSGIQDAIFGTFAECESDRAIYNYLNYQVFSRVMWDHAADVDAIIAEHDRLMFGAAAAEMHAFNAIIEKAWTERIAGNCIVTELGPEPSPPCAIEIWTDIYGEDFLKRLEMHLRAARKVVSGDSIEGRRLARIYHEFYKPLEQASKRFHAEFAPETERAWRSAHPDVVNLLEGQRVAAYVPFEQSPALVTTGQVVEVGLSLTSDKLRLKPNTRYRMSFFVKLENVRPIAPGGGLDFRLWDSKNNWFPKSKDGGSLYGTTDWIAQHYEIVTDGETNNETTSYFDLELRRCTGKAYYNSIRIDEIP